MGQFKRKSDGPRIITSDFKRATVDRIRSGAAPRASEEPWLASLAAAAACSRQILAPEAGRPLLRLGDRVDPEDLPTGTPLCVRIAGVSLHAAVTVPGRDRRRPERLCRYVARPAVASERLSRLDDGRLIYRYKRHRRNGTAAFVFEPDPDRSRD